MSLLVPPRVDEPELLDEHDAPRADMERSLRDLRRINKYLGGRSIYRKLLKKHGGARSVIDVGTGTSDLLEQVDGLRIGVDFKIEHLLYFRGGDIRKVVGDALHLPFRDGAADVVTSSHFFHHFTPDENAQILTESLRVSRRGVVVNDTARHYVPLYFVLLLCALRLFGRITRSDAPGSVRRGYTTAEVREIVDRVAAKRKAIVSAWPFRFGILLWK
jgi:ubiquinone/menaquinone biosynthesis C-methylase UbiE